jgi:hypothetical protein
VLRVEDRLTRALYLEMFDGPIDEYASTRGIEVLALPGVDRATWWANDHRDRADLPRETAEFSHLALYEVGADFRTPVSVVDGIVDSYHYVRTVRPGQGTMSGAPTIGLLIVLFSAHDEGCIQDLRDWADFVHLRHIAESAIPGYTMITPYVNAEPRGHPRFTHLYEMDCPEPEVTFKRMLPIMTARFGGTGSDYFAHWMNTPLARLMYCSSFRLVGKQPRV